MREFAFSGFVLTPALMRLDQDGQPIALPNGAFNVLLILIENRDRVVTKRELLDRVWAGTTVEENNLQQCISALRKALGDTRKEARFIITVPGSGYRFVMEVLERERKPAGATSEDDPIPMPAPRQRFGLLKRHRLALGIALGACLLVGATGWHAILRTDTAVLVLPIESFGSPGGDSDYVRKGVATEIEAALARTPGLNVAMGVPDSVIKTTDVREVARRVNAHVVLRGQVRESGDWLAFTFELVNPVTTRILWSDQFGVKREELAGAESRVVSGILKTLEPGRAAPELRKVNPAAHELYLRGRLLASTRQTADLENSIQFYRRALEIDPDYADAYTGIADAAGLRAANGAAPPGVLETARTAGVRAVELDPGSAPAHAALGLVYYADWNWAEARRELQQALQLNPNYSITHHRLALLHYVFNDYNAAESELKLAQEINPYVFAHAFTLAEMYIGARRYAAAIRTSETVLQGVPDNFYPHFLEMQAYQGMGNRAAAVKELRLGIRPGGDPPLDAMLAILEGRIADAERLAAEHGSGEIVWASVYAQLGDSERMEAVLRKLIDNRDVIVVAIKDDPVFDRYRPERAFRDLISRLHLPR